MTTSYVASILAIAVEQRVFLRPRYIIRPDTYQQILSELVLDHGRPSHQSRDA